MLYLCLFLACFLGVYLSCIDKKHQYAWLLGYITLLMVVFGGMANPSPAHFIELAFNRSLEVAIGIVASLLVTYCVLPRRAQRLLQQDTLMLSQCLHEVLLNFIVLYQQDGAEYHTHIEDKAREIIAKLEKRQDRWQLYRLSTFFDLILHQRRSFARHPNNAYLAKMRVSLQPCLQQVEQCFQALMDYLARRPQAQNALQAACQQFDHHWKTLVQTAEQQRQRGSSLKLDTNTIDAGFQALLTLRMMVLEMQALLHPLRETRPQVHSVKQRCARAFLRLVHYDAFYLQHAALAACALLFMPMLWLFFNLPGFAQIAVSIGAVIGMDPENTRYKGFLRIVGCGAGLVLALVMLVLDIQSISFLLFVVFSGTALFAYVHYDKSEVSYFGTQAVIVFFIGVVASLGPTIHMDIAIERLVAIILGVSSIVLFQHVFWRFRGIARCRHHIRQFKCAMQPIMTVMVRHHTRAYTVWPNMQPCFLSMRLALRYLRDTHADMFFLLRELFYQTYFLVELMQNSVYPKLLVTLYPEIEQAITHLCHDLVKPYFSSSEKQRAYEQMVQLENDFVNARGDCQLLT